MAISEDDSPVVKLVNSTLYDALKARRERHPPRDRARATWPSSTGSTACCNHVAHGRRARARRAGDFAHQGDGRTGHRRAPRAAGRTLQGALARPRDRLARLGHAQHLRRGRRAADPRQAGAVRSPAGPDADFARLRQRHDRRDPAPVARALRHAAGDRPDRQRQDDDAVRRDQRDQPRRGQDRHHRGPGRVPAAGRPADPGQREEGTDLRARPALDPAPRPGQASWSARSATPRPRRSPCRRR